MMTTRIDIMKTFDTRSLPYRSMKNHWRILQKIVENCLEIASIPALLGKR